MSFAPYLGNKKGQVHKSKIKLAMAIKNSSNINKYKIDYIQKDTWDQTAYYLKINNKQYKLLMEEIIENSLSKINKLNEQLPTTFPSIIAETITKDLKNHINILKQ